MDMFSNLLVSLRFDNRSLGGNKRSNCQLTNLQVFQLIVLMPFFAIKGFSHYKNSILNRMFGGRKDVFYSFMAQDHINWRRLIYRMSVTLVSSITCRKDFKKSHLPAVLIADDSDLPKTGFRMEAIGKIFSHIHQKCILGYKALMLCWSDGRTQFMLDVSLHGEKGKVEGKEQGMTAEQRKRRYEHKRDAGSHAAGRKEEYFMGKGEKLIKMVKAAIRYRIPFDYLLVDSWFTNTGLVDFVCSCHKKFHLLGMAKMGNTKYSTSWGDLSARAILGRLSSSRQIRYSRRYHIHYAMTDVKLGTRQVRLFFCRRGKAEGWRMLLTTDTSVDFMRAYEIYTMRWVINFLDLKHCLLSTHHYICHFL